MTFVTNISYPPQVLERSLFLFYSSRKGGKTTLYAYATCIVALHVVASRKKNESLNCKNSSFSRVVK